MSIKYIFSIFLLVILFSCEEQLVMVPEFVPPVSERVVLIEEQTGVSCPNCPSGTAQIESLKAQYGKNVVAVGIHGSFLSWPTPESKYDFRIPAAAELEEYLKPWQGKPAASISRVQYTDELSVSNPQLWSNYVDQELEKKHLMDIDIATSYDESSRNVSITATIEPKEDFTLDDKLNISVMILQSEIEDAQEDGSTIIEEYEHNHVLRAMLTGAKGNPINIDLVADQQETFSFNYTIPKDDELKDKEAPYNPAHMEVVVFVHKVSGDTKDVLQAAEAKVIQ